MDSSSRRNVVKGIGLCAAAATCTGLVGLYRARSLEKHTSTPRFAIARGSEAACQVPEASMYRRELQVAVWLSFATLGPGARDRLLTALESLLDSVEARLHPLGVDLLDESPEQIARREAPWLLPIWTAARTIARRCFVAGDRSLAVVVRAAETSAPPTFASFDPFSTTGEGAELRLARFLCWPISAAVRVRLEAGKEHALRERCGAPASALALVIDGPLQAVDVSVLQQDLRQRLQSIRERLSRLTLPKCDDCESFADVIDALSSGLPHAPALDWLELAPKEALAVPRLSAASHPEAFLRELVELEIPVTGNG